ncbi:MAG TPA: response regulator [Urbifossiella sp.]|nr:response regulator [Urbifossiella sp.]
MLVADDNYDAADTLGGLLLLCGATVRVCCDGAEAAQLAEDFRPDVGLFDANMPGLDGCGLARRARDLAGRRPLLLVAITGVSDHEAQRRTAAAGFNLHLTKPADPAGLIRTCPSSISWSKRRLRHPSRKTRHEHRSHRARIARDGRRSRGIGR